MNQSDLRLREPAHAVNNATFLTDQSRQSNPDNPGNSIFGEGSMMLLVGQILSFLVGTLGIILNAAVLLAFRRNPKLINAFTVHVLNLTVINLVAGTVFTVLIKPCQHFDQACLSIRANCAVYRFCVFNAAYMIIHQHLVICLDRWAALVAPVWYRQKTVRHGWLATLGCTLSGVAWSVAIIGFEFAITLPPNAYCKYPIQTVILSIAVVCTVMVPQGFIYISYPVLLYLVWRKKGLRCHGVNGRPTPVALVPQAESEKGKDSLSMHRPSSSCSSAESRCSGKRNKNSAMVACLTFAQMLLWLPNTVEAWGRVEYLSGDGKDLAIALKLMCSLLLLVDPLIYLAFLPRLRRATFDILRISRSVSYS
ncbi:hypothetical protein BV898_08555 [Hypsibius exemplaris]|uniref:G-protein coupled receptors family 1 profile domain-containing protein n=1 Tax=Hypsibius exemplaris TaxID=2072580 RepID=A0A1W0WQ28_HYPEX|nr:hypothetical protein BV898_08555 [Hypsibius exemplaris]